MIFLTMNAIIEIIFFYNKYTLIKIQMGREVFQ